MMANAAKKSAEPTVVEVDAAQWLGKLKVIGGSKNDDWNSIVAKPGRIGAVVKKFRH
jgi:hypothetical protein